MLLLPMVTRLSPVGDAEPWSLFTTGWQAELPSRFFPLEGGAFVGLVLSYQTATIQDDDALDGVSGYESCLLVVCKQQVREQQRG